MCVCVACERLCLGLHAQHLRRSKVVLFCPSSAAALPMYTRFTCSIGALVKKEKCIGSATKWCDVPTRALRSVHNTGLVCALHWVYYTSLICWNPQTKKILTPPYSCALDSEDSSSQRRFMLPNGRVCSQEIGKLVLESVKKK